MHSDAGCHRARKAGAPAEEYLGHFAMACHRARAAVSGALEPLYRLHASRLKLLMAPDPDLPLIARHCFLKSTAKQVLTPRSRSMLWLYVGRQSWRTREQVMTLPATTVVSTCDLPGFARAPSQDPATS